MKILEVRTEDQTLIATFSGVSGDYKVHMAENSQGTFQNYIDYGIETYFVDDSGIRHLVADPKQSDFLEKIGEYLKIFSNFNILLKNVVPERGTVCSHQECFVVQDLLLNQENSQWEVFETILNGLDIECEFSPNVPRNRATNDILTNCWSQYRPTDRTRKWNILSKSAKPSTQPDQNLNEVINPSEYRLAS